MICRRIMFSVRRETVVKNRLSLSSATLNAKTPTQKKGEMPALICYADIRIEMDVRDSRRGQNRIYTWVRDAFGG